ncbi:MAG: hypothetical protein EBT92_03115 [Planctomycetes bacterium]|nr:hypothetical protein [Planctomycetota bacterium]NBY03728.1 hypothetical protein [Planctomycetota bacterium]
MLVNPSKGFLMVFATFLISYFLFFTRPVCAQTANAPIPAQNEPGDKTYTRNLLSGVFAFVSSIGILVLICMPGRKNS